MRKTDDTYSYPIVDDWNKQELVEVCHFYENIEQAYEKGGVDREKLLQSYRRFQEINPSKVEQNNLTREFEKNSGLDIYHTVKMAKENPEIQKITQQ